MLPIRSDVAKGSGVVGSRVGMYHPITGKPLAGTSYVANPARDIYPVKAPQFAATPSKTPPQARGRGLVGNALSIPNVDGNRGDANRSTPLANKVNYGANPVVSSHTVSTVTNGGPGNSNAHLIEGAGSLSDSTNIPGALNTPGQEVEQRADNLRITQAARAVNYGTATQKALAGSTSQTELQPVANQTFYSTSLLPPVNPDSTWVMWIFIAAALVAIFSFATGKASL